MSTVNLSAYIEGSQGLADAFLDEVVCDASGGVLIENRVHQSDLGGAASRFSLGGTELADGNTPIISSFNLDVVRCRNYATRQRVSHAGWFFKKKNWSCEVKKMIIFIPGSCRSSCRRGGWRSTRREGCWMGPFHKQLGRRSVGRRLWLASSAKTPAKLPPHLLQHTGIKEAFNVAATPLFFFCPFSSPECGCTVID